MADPTFTGRCTASAEVFRFPIREMRLRATDGSFATLASGDRSFDVARFTANPSSLPPGMQVPGSDPIITDTSASCLPLTVADGDGIDCPISFDAGSSIEFAHANGSCIGADIDPLGATLSFTKQGGGRHSLPGIP